MFIPKLRILAESENWIIVVDPNVTMYELFNSYNGRGKVTAAAFPLYLMNETVKGVVIVAFGNESSEHRSISIPECLNTSEFFAHRAANISMISSLYREHPVVAGCSFRLDNVVYEYKDGTLTGVKQVTFWDSSGRFGACLKWSAGEFDIRRLLRVWFQHTLKWTKSSITTEFKKGGEVVKMDEVSVSLNEDTEHCLAFMLTEPLSVFNSSILTTVSDDFKLKVRNTFGVI